jgi:hypothetical protein
MLVLLFQMKDFSPRYFVIIFAQHFIFRFVVEVCLTVPLFICISSDIILLRRLLSVHTSVLIFSPLLSSWKLTGRQANLSSSTSHFSVNLLYHTSSLFIGCLLHTTNVIILELSETIFITRNLMCYWNSIVSETNYKTFHSKPVLHDTKLT